MASKVLVWRWPNWARLAAAAAVVAGIGVVIYALNSYSTARASSPVTAGQRAALSAMMLPPHSSAAGTTPPPCAPGTIVSTRQGPVCGLNEHGVKSWLGVPYGAAPSGRFRWAPPRSAAYRTAMFHATANGNLCPQPGIFGSGPVTTENCLNLNVQAPSNARPGRSKLPVMVEIHGGGFEFLGPDDGTPLVQFGHVVYVGINYRLGILGFMANKALGPHSGDYGLEDQQAALRWVQHNIARFGGDPHNVTIFGASAGGSSVCDATASPTAAGLFQKGISESGEYNALIGPNTVWQPQDCKTQLPTEAQAQAAGARFAANVGCASASNQAACLRKVPVATLLKAVGNGLSPDSGTIAPIVNGTTLTMSPGRAFAKGAINHVSLMIGVARDENYGGSAVPVASAAQYRKLIRQQYGTLAPAVLHHYPLARFPSPSPFIAHRTVVADSDADCPAMLNDQRLSRHIPVYAYEMDDADAPPELFVNPKEPNGSYHVDEVFLLFSTSSSNLDPNQQALAYQLKAEWTGFARTGTPTVPGAPRWNPYTPGHPVVMSLVPAGDSALTDDIPAQHNCTFWDAVAAGPAAAGR